MDKPENIPSAAPHAGIRIENAAVWFPVRRGIFAKTVAHVKAVEDLSLDIRPGETIGVAGESGSGKTTLGRAIAGLERLSAGRISVDGRMWAGPKLFPPHDKQIRRRIQMIFQDPHASLNPRLTVCDLLTEGMVQYGLLQSGETKEEAATRLLRDVGLPDDVLWRYPFEFSGGQRQRICIARAIAMRPDYIVCDEVVSALDVSIQAQIINLLVDLRTRHQLSYLMIGHDISVLRHMCHRMAVMYLGRIVEQAPADELVENPLHPYTQALLSAVPIPGETRPRIPLQGEPPSPLDPPSGCPFHPRCPKAMDICRAQLPVPTVQKETHTVACHLFCTCDTDTQK